jgi:hypothetical protein
MPKARPLSKDMVLAAMAKTKSNKAAARYLGVSYIHYKRLAKFYIDENTGQSLFESHLNQAGVGIPKFSTFGKKSPGILEVIEGRVDASHFTPDKIKNKLIHDGLIEDKCCHCGFNERRVLDYKVPLLMHFKDDNKKNYKLDNIELLCYNCYFLTIGDIFTNKQIQQIEDFKPVNEGKVDWEIDEYHLQRLKELGLEDDEEEFNYISRI